jgi:hypothetical protein
VAVLTPRSMRHSSFAPPNNIVTQLHVKIGVLEST